MSTHKHIDKICVAAVIFALAVTLLFMNGEKLGIQKASAAAYEGRLFDTSRVHTIDIAMDDWDGFIETCENEEYAPCTVTIDGEACSNVGIRAKGNTSLSSVSRMDSRRYSFKIEFDQYDSGSTYYGLDKLSLNNIIQDNTYMKDYLCYRLMGQFGVSAPLCSYAYITVNGEDWGLYLAVEAVEESFLSRNYGSGAGELYKPDSTSFGGGRGNGRNFAFDADAADPSDKAGDASSDADQSAVPDDSGSVSGPADNREAPDPSGNGETPDGNTSPPQMPAGNGNTAPQMPDSLGNGGPPQMPGGDADGNQDNGSQPPAGTADQTAPQPPEGGAEDELPQMPGSLGNDSQATQEGALPEQAQDNGFGRGAMGSADVKLQYIDDDPASYANIFSHAKTDVTEADQTRLIASLKALSENQNIDSVVDVEQVIRYFVVHNFVCNGDSYTGSMVHNYYLYEKDGQLSMIPWDYNLAFGGFQAGNAASVINEDIDQPVTSGDLSDRPMLAWIFADEAFTELYHQYFSDFISEYCDGGQLAQMIEETSALIAPYVEKDPTKFCTTDDFETGVSALQQFCLLRGESVSLQLSGSDEEIDASGLNLSDMGSINSTMGTMGGAGGGKQLPDDDAAGQQNDSAVTQPGDGAAGQPDDSGIIQPGDGAAGQPPGRQVQADAANNQSQDMGEAWILLAVSAVILLAGLAVVIKYRR